MQVQSKFLRAVDMELVDLEDTSEVSVGALIEF